MTYLVHMVASWPLSDKIAALAAISALAQFCALIFTWTTMRTTAQRQLRAYLVVTRPTVSFHGDGTATASVALLNCGQTPAYELSGASAARFTFHPVADNIGEPVLSRRARSTSVVGAGRTFRFVTAPVSGAGSRDELIRQISHQSDKVFCVRGHYTYRDIFKKTRVLRFQLIAGGPTGLVRCEQAPDGSFVAGLMNDFEGNDAT